MNNSIRNYALKTLKNNKYLNKTGAYIACNKVNNILKKVNKVQKPVVFTFGGGAIMPYTNEFTIVTEKICKRWDGRI